MQKISTTTILFDPNRNEIARYISNQELLDNEGNLIEQTDFYEDDVVERKIVFKYNEDGVILEQAEYDGSNTLIQKQEFILNAEGQVEKSILYYSDKSQLIKEYELSDLGNADRAYLTNEKGEYAGEEIFEFDDDNNLICEIEKDETGREVLRLERSYSSSGLVLEEKKFIEGSLEDWTLFSYNENDLLLERVVKDTKGNEFQKETIVYNDDEQIIRKVITGLEGEWVEDYEYDETGNMILNSVYRNEQLIFRICCEYSEENELIAEDVMEIDPYGNIQRNFKRIIEYKDL